MFHYIQMKVLLSVPEQNPIKIHWASAKIFILASENNLCTVMFY
jgi:hypothetical protein